MSTTAVLGTGHMGTAIARRLAATGQPVLAWNRTATRAHPLADVGVRLADTPAEAVREADIVITMLSDVTAVEAALFGPDGAATALRPGSCLVQMSTISPAEARGLVPRLPDGVSLVEAPVAGSVPAVSAGTAGLLVGGADEPVERVAAVLATLGTTYRCGDVGTGAAMKLVLNTALTTGLAALADTLAVADAVGVDRTVALAQLAAGPLGGAVQRGAASGAAFALRLAAKDLDLALRELGTAPAPVARATAGMLHAAAYGSGVPGSLRATAEPDADLARLLTIEFRSS